MAPIEQDDAARRLARLIISDFRLENQALIDLGADVSAEIAERRALFRSRTIESLHPVFEEVLQATELGRHASISAAESPVAAPTATPLATDEWQEIGGGQLGSVITFEGIDVDEQTSFEIANFRRAVKTVENEELGGDWTVSSGTPIMTLVGVALGCLLVFVSARVLKVDSPNSPAPLVAVPVLLFSYLLGFFLPRIVAGIRAWRARRLARPTTYTFRLALSPVQMVLEREGFRLALETGEIERFEGGVRLSVLRRNGAPLVLPCTLKDLSHAPLAARLNELLREQRGYRG